MRCSRVQPFEFFEREIGDDKVVQSARLCLEGAASRMPLKECLKKPSQEKRDDDWKKAAARMTDEEEMLPNKTTDLRWNGKARFWSCRLQRWNEAELPQVEVQVITFRRWRPTCWRTHGAVWLWRLAVLDKGKHFVVLSWRHAGVPRTSGGVVCGTP